MGHFISILERARKAYVFRQDEEPSPDQCRQAADEFRQANIRAWSRLSPEMQAAVRQRRREMGLPPADGDE